LKENGDTGIRDREKDIKKREGQTDRWCLRIHVRTRVWLWIFLPLKPYIHVEREKGFVLPPEKKLEKEMLL